MTYLDTYMKHYIYNTQTHAYTYYSLLQMKICDIEQLVTLGRKTLTCPYYGTRKAVPLAQVGLGY